MKKTYLNPELIVVKIATHKMLMLSAGGETDQESDLLGRDSDFDED